MLGHVIWMDHQRISQQALHSSGIQGRARSSKDKLERHSWQEDLARMEHANAARR